MVVFIVTEADEVNVVVSASDQEEESRWNLELRHEYVYSCSAGTHVQHSDTKEMCAGMLKRQVAPLVCSSDRH